MRIAVIFGGSSDEHEVSRLSAANVLNGLRNARYEIVKIGINKQGRWWLTEASSEEIADGRWIQREDNRPVCIPADPELHGMLVLDGEDQVEQILPLDCVFPVLHGKYGEDGTIQGLFEMAGIPYVGPGVKASANGMDKTTSKLLAAQTGVRMAKHVLVRRKEYQEDPETVLNAAGQVNGGKYPIFVKPAADGSSVGTSQVHSPEELPAAIEEALRHDDKVLVEEMIAGRELEVAVLGNENPKASCAGEILAAGEFYDYDAKYNNPASRTEIVRDLPESEIERLRSYAVAIYRALECRGLSRVDFFYTADGEIVFNEINTMPGFTNISMYPKLWEAMGVPQPTLLDTLVHLAMEREP